MSDNSNGNDFIGYEYKDVTVNRDSASLCADSYPSFGWTLEGTANPHRRRQLGASAAAYGVGIVGTAFMVGSVFAITANLPNAILCTILAIPGFIGWILPYFLYLNIRKKKTEKVMPFIDGKYDEIYTVCEKANALLA